MRPQTPRSTYPSRLIHPSVDDVEDSSLLRRGIPVAHSIFGTPQTINTANYVYFKALQDLLLMQNPKLIDIFTEELLNLHRGQGMDLYWRDSLTCPSEADYLEMVGNKTGGLFRLAIKLMQAESTVEMYVPHSTPLYPSLTHSLTHTPTSTHPPLSHPPSSPSTSTNTLRYSDCTPLVSHLGILFQILDDHLNLLPSPLSSTKGSLAEDLTEGKFSFPVIHAIRADPSNQILISILKQKTSDEEVKRYAVGYMERMGSFAYSEGVVRGLQGRCEDGVRGVEGGLGEGGREGAEALRRVLGRLVLS